MSITGGLIKSRSSGQEIDFIEEAQQNRGLVMVAGPPDKMVASAKIGANTGKPAVAKVEPMKFDPSLEPTKVWNEAFAKGNIEPGLVIATADFLFDMGRFDHAAEFLKADLRYGVVVRPWVYEALAVALEASGGDPEEIRRARLSAVSLDPHDANGFLDAAKAMAENKQYDRALAFCRQAAQLEPNMVDPYANALAYADLSKDSKAMEWAVSKLLGQDWTSDNQSLHLSARSHLSGLAQALEKDNRKTEAERLKLALQKLNERDLFIKIQWDSGSEPADVELVVTEPSGSKCSSGQRQTPGGGTYAGTSLVQMNNVSYTAAQAFTGKYEIEVHRKWGQPLGGRARLEIVQHLGTPQESRQMITIPVDRDFKTTVELAKGRRTDLASIAPPSPSRKMEDKKETNVFTKLREIAHPDYTGTKGPTGVAATPGFQNGGTSASTAKAPPAVQSAITAINGSSVDLTARVRLNGNLNEAELVLHPVFQTAGDHANLNMPLIPGGR